MTATEIPRVDRADAQIRTGDSLGRIPASSMRRRLSLYISFVAFVVANHG